MGGKFLLAFIRHAQRDALQYGSVHGVLLLAAAVLWLGSAVLCLILGKERAFWKRFFAGQSSAQAGLLEGCGGSRAGEAAALLAPAQHDKTAPNSCNSKYMHVFVFLSCSQQTWQLAGVVCWRCFLLGSGWD